MKKLKTRRGETLVETLASMLIISLALIMLASGIVSAARVNQSAEKQNQEFTTTVQKEVGEFKVNVTYGGSSGEISGVKGYQTGNLVNGVEDYENGYYYYEKTP